jgi:hypothetical protein
MKLQTCAWIMTLAFGMIFQNQAVAAESAQTEIEIGTVIPELNGYKNVTVRSIDPDGIRIMHESGAAKIPFERLTPSQREAFGISAEGAAEHRRNLGARALAEQARQQEAQRQASQNSQKSEKQAIARYVTSDQIKIYWFKKLPAPRKMDRNYFSAQKAREAFIAEIRAGFQTLLPRKPQRNTTSWRHSVLAIINEQSSVKPSLQESPSKRRSSNVMRTLRKPFRRREERDSSRNTSAVKCRSFNRIWTGSIWILTASALLSGSWRTSTATNHANWSAY